MRKTPLKRRTQLKSHTPLKARKGLNRISDKHQEELKEHTALIHKFRQLCNNRSELSGNRPDWQSANLVEPHHIKGRGRLLLDPFKIIMLTRTEHDIEEGKIKGSRHSKEELESLVYAIRIKQGFKENKQ